jgi:hypothetical protein
MGKSAKRLPKKIINKRGGPDSEEAPDTGGVGASSGSLWGEPVVGREDPPQNRHITYQASKRRLIATSVNINALTGEAGSFADHIT